MKRDKPTSDQILPPVADLVAEKPHSIFKFVDLQGCERTLDYSDLVEADPFPIPMPVDREGYSPIEHSDRYWATGHGDLLNVKEALNLYYDDAAEQLFDFGCSTGRFLRHVHCFSELEPHGCDFAPANVEWANRYLPEEIKIIVNTAQPVLPYEDETFCIVTAFSVFTHIDQNESEWLDELRRITKPGGLLYLTVQNQAAWKKVVNRPGMLDHMKRANKIEGNLEITKSLFEGPMPQEKISLKMSQADIYNRNVWVTNDYVKANWTKSLQLMAIANNAHNSFQSVVILRRN